MKLFHHLQQSRVEFSQNPTRRNGLRCLLNALVVLVAILTLSATAARAQTLTNWLANPGFESGNIGWVNYPGYAWNGSSWEVDSTNTLVYGGANKVVVRSGTNCLKIWGYFQSYGTTPGTMQTFAAAPGSTWTATGWASTQSPNQMTVAETSYIEVLFLDANTNTIVDYISAKMTTNSPVNTWQQFQVVDTSANTTLTAPAGTAFMRFLIRFYQPGGYPGGSCYWDDLALIRTSKPDPEITAQPVPQTKVYGQTATFSVTADGLSTLSYRWQKDSADITDSNAHGVTTSTLILSNVTTAMMGNYTVTVTDTAGPLTSAQAYLTVNDPGIISIAPPLGQTKTNGGTATMSVSAAGSSTLTYGWQLNGTPLSDGSRISGSASPTLNISALTAADAGTYTVLVNSGAATASTMLKVVPLSQLATNELINPGFEDGVLSEPWELGWVKFNGAALATASDYYYLSATPVSVYDGTYVCRTYASDPDDGLYENLLPAAAGATYHAGGHFYMSSLDPMTGPAWVVMQVIFKNAAGATIGQGATPQIGTNGTLVADTWTTLQVTNGAGGLDLVAPAGTASATCQVYEYAQIGGGGSVYFDDLYLTPVVTTPAPPPPPFSLTPSVSSGQFNISFQTTNGAIYEVLYTGNPGNALSTWQTNTTVIGDGTVRTVPDTLGAGARFYRVRAHNP